MLIAIDWDDTYTLDPPLWEAFIASAEARGHRVYCVTSRVDDEENREYVRIACLKPHRHIFTGGSAKRWFCETHKHLKIDVWLDDSPACIDQGK